MVDNIPFEPARGSVEPCHMHAVERVAPYVDAVRHESRHVAQRHMIAAERVQHGARPHEMAADSIEPVPDVRHAVVPATEPVPVPGPNHLAHRLVVVAHLPGHRPGEEAVAFAQVAQRIHASCLPPGPRAESRNFDTVENGISDGFITLSAPTSAWPGEFAWPGAASTAQRDEPGIQPPVHRAVTHRPPNVARPQQTTPYAVTCRLHAERIRSLVEVPWTAATPG